MRARLSSKRLFGSSIEVIVLSLLFVLVYLVMLWTITSINNKMKQQMKLRQVHLSSESMLCRMNYEFAVLLMASPIVYSLNPSGCLDHLSKMRDSVYDESKKQFTYLWSSSY